jgi:putative N6-adenine-specific DNA methylase
MPCAAGVEGLLADEVHQLTGLTGNDLLTGRGGVMANASWRDALRLNLHSRLTQRVLIQLSQTFYRSEKDLYDAASAVAWEIWFTTKQTFKIEITAQHSPLTSLNFAALKIKDAVADRFRAKRGERPDVNTQWPDVRIYVHLTTDSCTLYIDTSGDPLFKRGWREDKGDAPLKETLAAAMLAASGWDAHTPLYDPCCGSGTIAIEAAQIACGIAPGIMRRFAFEKLLPFQPHVWQALQDDARSQQHAPTTEIHASDVAFRMVDFTQRNAERAGVGVAGVSSRDRNREPGAPTRARDNVDLSRAREIAEGDDGGEFFAQLASHWKKNYNGWTAWMLTPDLKLPSKMRLKESRRVPMWNGPIECRMFRFDLMKGSVRDKL